MSATHQRLLTQLAILAVTGATAVSIAACSTSNNQNTGKPSTSVSPTSTAPKPPPPAPPMGHDHIEGLVRSLSGNTIQLTQRDRTAATVEFTPSTMVTELGPAKLTDVTPSSCVDVEAAAQSGPSGAPVTAQSVTISPSEGGRCPPPEPSSGGPAESPSVYGTVASVTGNTIDVTSTDPTGKTTHTNVNVTDTTTYTKHAVTNAQAIQNGNCMAAQGTNNGGVLQASTIDLEPCPPMGRPRHHFHFPWPHHRH
jgi:hypothetical protein